MIGTAPMVSEQPQTAEKCSHARSLLRQLQEFLPYSHSLKRVSAKQNGTSVGDLDGGLHLRIGPSSGLVAWAMGEAR